LRADVDRHAPKAVVEAHALTGVHTDTKLDTFLWLPDSP
jgi:hypothetical protein